MELRAEEKLNYDRAEMATNSGAGVTVAGPKDLPGFMFTDSPGSLAGQTYVGPASERMPNEGQFTAPLKLCDGIATHSTHQAAKAGTPLIGISSASGKGNLVLFDAKGSYIIPGGNKDLVNQARASIQKTQNKLELHRKKGVFHMMAWKLKPGFPRQGR